MDDSTPLKRWLAIVRVATGGVFVYMSTSHLLGGVGLSLNNLLMGFGAGGVHHSVNTLMLIIELGFLWTDAWRPYSLDSLLFQRGAPGTLRRATASQGG